MSSTGFKQQLFAQFARVAKALANGNRLELLEFLAQGDRDVESLAKVSGLSVANTSQHLQVLRQAGLVTSRKSGQHVIYGISGLEIVDLLTALQRVSETRLAEIDRLVESFLKVKDELESVPIDDLVERARAGLVTIVDVRPVEEYRAGHVPGAINVPLAKIESNINRLVDANEIVAYCRGPYCVLAYDAVAKLRGKGCRARRLAVGFPEWRSAGLPVENS